MEETVVPQKAEDTKEKKGSKAKDVWSIVAKAELPFWWTEGTSLSETQDPSYEKRRRKLLEKLRNEESRIYSAVKQVKAAQKAEEESFVRALAEQNKFFAEKEEEVRQYEAEQIAAYQLTLTKALATLEEEIHDNELRDMNNKALQKELQLKAESDKQQKEISDKIDSVMTEVAAEKEKTEGLEKTFRELMKERDELFPMAKDENGGYLGFFEKKYEAFNPENIFEIKEISLFDYDEKKYVLHIPTLSVQKGKITVIRSYRQNLTMIERLLYHSTASSVHIHTGEIRFDGRVISSVTREEYKAMLGTEIVSVNLTADEMLRSEKNVFAHFGLKKDDAAFSECLDALGVEKQYRRAKCNELPEEVLRVIAICYAVSRKPKLAVLEEPFNGLSKDYASRLTTLLNKKGLGLTALLLTQKPNVAVSLRNSRLYVI